MKISWTCYAGTQTFDVVTTTHMESEWELGFFLFVLECLELQITFFVVDGLVVWLRCLSGKIVVHIISKFLACKDLLFSLLLTILNPRSQGEKRVLRDQSGI